MSLDKKLCNFKVGVESSRMWTRLQGQGLGCIVKIATRPIIDQHAQLLAATCVTLLYYFEDVCEENLWKFQQLCALLKEAIGWAADLTPA